MAAAEEYWSQEIVAPEAVLGSEMSTVPEHTYCKLPSTNSINSTLTNINYFLPELFEAQLKSMTSTYKSFLQNIDGAGIFNLSELYYCWRNSLIVSIMYFRIMNLKILWSLM